MSHVPDLGLELLFLQRAPFRHIAKQVFMVESVYRIGQPGLQFFLLAAKIDV